MNIPSAPGQSGLSLSVLDRVDEAGDRFEAAWEAGQRPPLEAYLTEVPEPERSVLLHELLLAELGYRRRGGEAPTPAEYRERFPDHTAVIWDAFRAAGTPAASLDTRTARASTPAQPGPTRSGGASSRPTIRGYEILDELGRGGMGVVYRARQVRLDRLVALKMIRAGAHASAEELARFRTEAALQARMQHPHIVQIFEIGETAEGPYFALELIDGLGLDKYVAGTPQPAAAAARLVETLARAVHHAHEKGLVHRDLKPANILSAADGTPKVGDFGLARRLEGEAGQTQNGAVVGTPSYMAPEQACGRLEAIGPATDVYALGAVLYELLTGRAPFLGANALDTVLQVRHQEPVPPRRLLPSVPRDLEIICLKCLHKEPARRYATAANLAEDLRRFLTGEPIVARPVGRVERGLKWARRRPTAAALAGVLLALLAGGVVGGLWYAGRERERADRESALREKAEYAEQQAREGEQRAKRAGQEGRAVLDFFQELVMAAARRRDEFRGLGKEITLRAAIDAAAPGVDRAFAGQPAVEAAIRHALGQSYIICLEKPDLAVPQFAQALALRQEVLGPDHPDTVATMNNLALAYQAASQPEKAVPLFQRTLDRQTKDLGPDHPDTLATMNNLALAYQGAGQLDKALPLFQRTLALRQDKLGPDDPDTLTSMNNLALAYQAAGQLDKAVPLFERTLARRKEVLDPDNLGILVTMQHLARAYQDAGQPDKAVKMFELTLAGRQEKLGPDHPGTLVTMNSLAGAYWATGQREKAIRLFEDTLAKRRAKLGPDHPGTLNTMTHLARAYRAADQHDKAVSLFEDVLAKRQAKLGPEHADTLLSMIQLANACQQTGDLARAEKLLRSCLTIRQKQQPDAWTTFHTESLLGGCLLRQKQYAAAEPLLLAAYAGMKRREATVPARDKGLLTDALKRLVRCYDAWGKPEQASEWRQQLEQARPPAK